MINSENHEAESDLQIARPNYPIIRETKKAIYVILSSDQWK
jgi:hypothetical protein